MFLASSLLLLCYFVESVLLICCLFLQSFFAAASVFVAFLLLLLFWVDYCSVLFAISLGASPGVVVAAVLPGCFSCCVFCLLSYSLSICFIYSLFSLETSVCLCSFREGFFHHLETLRSGFSPPKLIKHQILIIKKRFGLINFLFFLK